MTIAEKRSHQTPPPPNTKCRSKLRGHTPKTSLYILVNDTHPQALLVVYYFCDMVCAYIEVQVHTEVEMDRVLGLEKVELIGINNRDLGTAPKPTQTFNVI